MQRGRLDAAQRDAILARLQPVDADVKLSDVGLVIEVIVEDLEVKVAVLRQIESEVGPDAIIATNTSSLSVTAIAGRLARPDRVVGMHFFNPAPVLPLVEVVSGAATAPDVTPTIFETAKAWGKVPVACRSTPGFIVNRVARPYYGEALRLLQEQAATPATLDAVMRECGGFKMGPCELMDLIGHDVNFAVTKSVYEGFFDDPRYKPSLIQKDLVDAGWLGRKSGRGFFDYREGAPSASVDEAGVRGRGCRKSCASRVTLARLRKLGRLLLGRDDVTVRRSDGAGLLRVDGFAVALSDGRTATERSVALGEPVVLFDLALDYAACARVAVVRGRAGQRRASRQGDRIVPAAGQEGVGAGRRAWAGGDAYRRHAGQRGGRAVSQGIASADDIDAAMLKGVNYPIGPMAWGQQVGLAYVGTVLRHLARAYGEDRYRSSLWLQRAVHAAQALGAQPWLNVVRAERQGRVGIVTIARPERRNALNLQVKLEIVDHLQALARDGEVAVVVLTGEGGYFVAGTDIAEMADMRPTDHVRLDTDRVFHVVRQSPKPVIAAVEGYALGGGCELALACDMIVAAEDAKFGQPEIRVGIMPGAGGTQRLLRTVGRYKTLLWSLTGADDRGACRLRGQPRERTRAQGPGAVTQHSDCRANRFHAATRGAGDSRSGSPGRRCAAGDGTGARAAAVRAPVRHPGPEGRNAGVPRKAQTGLPGSLKPRSPGGGQHGCLPGQAHRRPCAGRLTNVTLHGCCFA